MATKQFPYRQRQYGDALVAIGFGIVGLLNVVKPGVIIPLLGAAMFVLAGLLLWHVACTPRLLVIDTTSGTATFLPHYSFSPSTFSPISLRDYSVIYWSASGNGHVYSVSVANRLGESKRLLHKVPLADAERICDFASRELGLHNRGFMGLPDSAQQIIPPDLSRQAAPVR